MKRILALFLAVTLLIGVMGTAAAAEASATPEIAAPTIKSAAIDADGVLTVVPGDTDYEDGQWADVEIHTRYGWSSWYGIYYNAEKKAFISDEYSKDDIKGGEIEQIELYKRGTNRSETTGNTSINFYSSSYFYYNADLKLTSAQLNETESTQKDGKYVTEKRDSKYENYDEEEGYLSSRQINHSVREYNEDGTSVSKGTNETTWFDENGAYNGSSKAPPSIPMTSKVIRGNQFLILNRSIKTGSEPVPIRGPKLMFTTRIRSTNQQRRRRL